MKTRIFGIRSGSLSARRIGTGFVAVIASAGLSVATVGGLGALAIMSMAQAADASPVRGSRLTSANMPGGTRGDVVTWRVRLMANGQPVAGVPVAFTSRSDGYRTRTEGVAFTDHNGFAQLRFRIPTNVNADNVILGAISGGGPFISVAEQRVAIGRR